MRRRAELGCTCCRREVLLPIELECDSYENDVAQLITWHYRHEHPRILDDFMQNYMRFLFAKVGLNLPI